MLRNEPQFGADEPAESPALVRRRQQILGAAHGGNDLARQPSLLAEPEFGEGDPGGDPDIPPMPAGTAPLVAEDGAPGASDRRRGLSRLWTILAASALVVVVGAAWWAHETADRSGDVEVPLIIAANGPDKVRPEDEGGMDVPNQDILVYGRLGGITEKSPAEVLLSEPEAPIAVPAPIQSEAQPAVTDAGPDVPGVPVSAAPSLPEETTSGDAVAETESAAGMSVPAPAAEPSPETTQTASLADAFRVQLAAVKSGDAASAAWTKLTKAHPGVLDGLSLKVVKVDLGAAGIFYRVQAGPLSDRQAAEGLCSKLKAQNQPCLVVTP